MAAVAFATAAQGAIPLLLEKGSTELRNTLSPFLRYVENSTENVTRGNSIGRDFKVLWPVELGVAGAISFRPAVGVAGATGDLDQFPSGLNSILRPNTMRLFPGIDQATLIGWEDQSLQLIEMTGNMFLPIEMMRLDGLPNNAVKMLERQIRGTAMKKAHAEAVMFFTADADWHYLGTVPTGATAPSAATWTFAPSNGRIYMFVEGLYVDFINSADGALLNTVKVLVSQVAPVAGTVTFATVDGSTTFASFTGLGAGDYIILAGTREGSSSAYGMQGINSWLKSSGTILGLTIANFPRLASYVASIGGTLTETILNKYVSAYFDAYGPYLDAAVTTSGVLNAYIDDLEAQFRIDRTSGPVNVEQGFEGLSYRYGGKSLKIWADPLCLSGHFYSCQTRNGNIKRYSPPRIAGMGSHADFGGEVEFVASWDRGGSIFKNYHGQSSASDTTVNTTNYVEAPFSAVFNYMAKHPQGIKLTECEELTV